MDTFKYINEFIEYGHKTLESLHKFAVDMERENLLNNLQNIYLNYSNFSAYALFILTDKKLLKATFYEIKKHEFTKEVYKPDNFYVFLREIDEIFNTAINKPEILGSFFGLEFELFHNNTGALTANAGDIYEELYRIFIIKNKHIAEFEVSLEHILYNHDTFLKLEIKKYIIFLSFYVNLFDQK
ncbi:hypothetical protein [Persephonella sp.]|uniref:hypothetical protein n=1 Tax=Persephonella sp. TaxID=2060922 RepID=UPI002624F97B|nr:hypothetical protein [Persephonella sp.]